MRERLAVNLSVRTPKGTPVRKLSFRSRANLPQFCPRRQNAIEAPCRGRPFPRCATLSILKPSFEAPYEDVLRFPSAVKHDPAIDAWLRAQRDDLRPLANVVFLHKAIAAPTCAS